MARVDESSAQSREPLARRLELSALRIEDDRVTGTVGGFEVRRREVIRLLQRVGRHWHLSNRHVHLWC
jgi:hypothetical protein